MDQFEPIRKVILSRALANHGGDVALRYHVAAMVRAESLLVDPLERVDLEMPDAELVDVVCSAHQGRELQLAARVALANFRRRLLIQEGILERRHNVN